MNIIQKLDEEYEEFKKDNSYLFSDEVKSILNDVKTAYKSLKFSSNKIILSIVNHPIFKVIYNPVISLVVNHTQRFNRCIQDNTLINCSGAAIGAVITDLSVKTVATTFISSSFVLPKGPNYFSFGSGVYLINKNEEIVNSTHDAILNLCGVNVSDISKNQLKFQKLNYGIFDSETMKLKLTDGSEINISSLNLVYLKEILTLFEEGIFNFSMSLDNVKYSEDYLKEEMDVLFFPEKVRNTNVGNCMLQADIILKHLFLLDINIRVIENQIIKQMELKPYGAYFDLSSLDYIILNNEIIYQDDIGINMISHTYEIKNYDELSSDLKSLFDERLRLIKQLDKYVYKNYMELSEKYPQLKDLIELTKSFTFANIIYYHNISYNINIEIPEIRCPEKYIDIRNKSGINYHYITGGVQFHNYLSFCNFLSKDLLDICYFLREGERSIDDVENIYFKKFFENNSELEDQFIYDLNCCFYDKKLKQFINPLTLYFDSIEIKSVLNQIKEDIILSGSELKSKHCTCDYCDKLIYFHDNSFEIFKKYSNDNNFIRLLTDNWNLMLTKFIINNFEEQFC